MGPGLVKADSMRTLAVASAIAVLPVAMVVLGPPLSRYAGVIATILAVATCFGATARRDPVGFASIGLPPVLLGLTSAAVGSSRSGILPLSLALVWILVFQLGRNGVWAWWTRHVLRRQLPSPQRTFEIPFSEAVGAFMAETGDLPADASPSEPSRERAARAREALAVLVPPDDDWRELRDGWLAVMADGLSWFGAPPLADARQRQVEVMWRLSDRQRVLRGRESEWRGLYPTLPRRDVRSGQGR